MRSRIGAGVSVSDYQLGDPGFGGFTYQSVDTPALIIEGVTGFLPGGPYDDSVTTGRHEIAAYLSDRHTQCEDELYVLGGYSEGADVMGSGLFDLPQSVRDRIAFVALFGDPKLDTGNWRPPNTLPIGGFLPSCFLGKKSWIRGSAPCWITGGIFGSRTPYIPVDMDQRVGSWCRNLDPACIGSPADIQFMDAPDFSHRRYFDPDSDSAFAALEAVESLATFLPAHSAEFDLSHDQFIGALPGADLAIIFDTTGSMSGEILDAKAQATELAETWISLFENGRVGLVEFRDQGDAFVARVDQQLTSDPGVFQTAVDALVATGGGDTPEAQLSGIMAALDGLSWADGATKAAVVITDAPGKDPEPTTNLTRADVAQHALEIDPVAIYGINVTTSTSVSDWMAPLAGATAGAVFTLQSGQSWTDSLFAVLETVRANPVAMLDGPYIAETGTAINFSAANSFPAEAPLVSFNWDFDLDGTIDRTTTSATTTYTYPGEYHGMASVEVVADDGRSALATTEVTVDSVGLADLQPITPLSALATATAADQVTVSWTPAANDRADGYKIYLGDGTPVRHTLASDPHSVVVEGLDLSEPVQLWVVASNTYGDSAGAAAPPIGDMAPDTTEIVSISTTRAKGNGASLDAYISGDGRYVVYHSDATNLDPADTNNVRDVFVHDRVTQTTSLVSTTAAGVVGTGASTDPAISKDGRYVTFRSQANNLVTGDTNGTAWDIFVKDLQTGEIERVSVSSAGAQQNGASQNPTISADGRFVTFRSSASNLVAGDTNAKQDVFVRDRVAGTTSRVSVATGGTQGNGDSDEPVLSDDGRYVAFQSDATNLVTGDTNGVTDIFRHDRDTGTTIRVSVSSSGTQANGVTNDAAISGDGSLIAFESEASNHVAGDTNGKEDVFVHDVATGTTTRVSVSDAGVQGNKGSSDPSISTNGTKIAFYSTATGLVTGDTNNRGDIFLRDLTAGTTVRSSLTASDDQANDASSNPWLSGDGSAIAFQSVATNLVPEDTDATNDVYVRGPSMAE